MSSRSGRRVATRPPSRWMRLRNRIALPRIGGVGASVALGVLLVVAGLALLLSAMLGVGPGWFEYAGAVAVGTTYVAALAGRVGGRPLPIGAAGLVVGIGVVLSGSDMLRAGAAAMLCVIAAVLAVMMTVPAVRTRHAVRETLIALAIAVVGSFAAIGLTPVVEVTRFEYMTLALALIAALLFVYRLGAGLHGLGRRGLVVVIAGGLVLAVTLAYTEMLRRYGSPGMVENVLAAVGWVRETFGAVPRPIEILLGIPALMWGSHMRARRRQGWWVCAFGVAATVPVGHSLMNPAATVAEAALGQGYSIVLGILVGYAVMRIDLALTGQRGARARRAEEAAAVRPEPPRLRPLQ